MSSIETFKVAPNHYCADQKHPIVKQISARLPWYTPKYSPHDVPRFYDITGVVRFILTAFPFSLLFDPCKLFICMSRALTDLH